jgi:hypothetical protein
MAATEECAHRACLRMADVTVIHSVTTRATGLTATVIGRGARLAVVSCNVEAASSSCPSLDMVAESGIKGAYATTKYGAQRTCRYGGGDGRDYMYSLQETHILRIVAAWRLCNRRGIMLMCSLFREHVE